MELQTYLSLPDEDKLLEANISQLDYDSLVQAYQIIEDESLSAKILSEMDKRIENNPSYQKTKEHLEEYTQKYHQEQEQKKQLEQQRLEELKKERESAINRNKTIPETTTTKEVHLEFYSFLGNLMIIAGIIGFIIASIYAFISGGLNIFYCLSFLIIQCLGAIILLLRKLILYISNKS